MIRKTVLCFALTCALGSGVFAADESPIVFDRIENASKYLAREPRFAKAFEFLARKDLAELPVGRYEIDGNNVYAMIQASDLRDVATKPQAESHRSYIDIQAPITGEEVYGSGWLSLANQNGDFDSVKDFGLYTKQPQDWRTLKPGEFAIFFPPYASHTPGCRQGGAPRQIRKLVIKVRKTGETLYNGIELPGVWPPRINLKNTAAMEVPYLEEKNIPKVIPIDLGRQLFVDDFLVAEAKGVTRVFGKPVKFEGNPVLTPETDVEIHRPGNSVALPKGGGMWWDADRKVFRLWYETGWCHRIAYAESADGIHWIRPKLDVVPGTNRLLPTMKVDSWSVVYDPDTTDPDERWKLQNSKGGHLHPIELYTSADGIHWNSRGVAGPAGDRTTMFYNPFRRVWAHSLRGARYWKDGFGGRNRSYFETPDFAGGSKWTWFEEGSARNPVQWQQADSTDVTYPDLNKEPSLYNFDAVAYESLMLGVREIHHGPENDICAQKGLPKITDIVFAYSRDGFHFSCPDRTPAIKSERWNAYGKKWDVGYVQPLGNICVIVGDELWFYYGAFGGDTSRLEPDHNNNCYYNGMYDHGAMGLAKMRRDGFVGMRGGVVTTRPVSFSGRRLFVNLSGSLAVDVLDEKGTLLKTLTPVKGDRTLLAVDDVSFFANRPVRFRFTLGADSTLYSFWVSRSDRGESSGYLAGGGPGYRGIRDEVKTETRSLDGAWKFIKDGTRFSDASKTTFDDSAWQDVTVPHDWAISGPFNPNTSGWQGKLPWRGTAWYRKIFTLDKDAWREIVTANKTAYLEFDGVMARPEVWVNGQKAGGWDYGYMSFQLDVTKLLREGENAIAVRCETHSHASRWYPGAGIYRSVRLVTRPETHVIPGSMDITTPVVTPERATVRVRYRTKHGTRDYTFEVPRPRLWSFKDPHLYALEAEGETFRYGIRTFKFDANKGFFLNGQRVQLKGVDLHSDMGILGMAFDEDVMKRQLLIMKDMGINALRTSHNAVAPQVLDLCDEMGIFVWNECFDKWDQFAGRKESENLEEYVSRNLKQFVRRDRNHPSVFCWSIGNEIGPVLHDKKPTGMTTERFRIFRAAVREEDVTRPVTIGCCSGLNHPGVDFSALDMTGWNYGANYRAMHAKYPKMPVLYSESASAVSEYGFYEQPPAADKTSYSRETLQVGSYDHCAAPWSDIADVEFDRMEKDSYCGGEFVWTGIDYLGEPTPIANGSSFGIHTNECETARSSYFGIVDLIGVPKDRFYLYKSYWNPAQTTVHILPHWNWSPAVKNLPVYVYTSGDEAELFLNGRSLGRRKKLTETKRPNLASGAHAFASTCEKRHGIVREAALALDGSNDTRWCAAGGATNEWLAIDFGKKTSFDRVTLELEKPQPSYGYDLQISDDGIAWSPYATKPFGARTQTFFRHAETRYLRVLFTSLKPGTYASVRQLLVNSTNDGASPFAPYYDVCGKYRLRWYDVPNEPGVLKAVAYRKGVKIGEETMRTAEKPVAVKLSDCPYNAPEARTRFVLVDLVDAKGTRDPLAMNRVSYRLEGPGKLIAVGNANPRGLDVFTNVASHPLYYGKGAAVVRRTGPGKLTLTATVPGLKPASLDIH